ncbi:MAG: glycosyltransferase family 4 protein [Actinobacteria bacterium]|nr:glycosyltransferase family 4 protein [Actinomycetota bacterium]
MKIAFLLNTIGLSGGVGVIMKHALALGSTHGHEVTIVLTEGHKDDHWRYGELDSLEITDIESVHERRFDVAIATWWETARMLGEVHADRHTYFVQSIEDRFYPPATIERMLATQTYNLPVVYITEAGWIRDTLTALNPGNPCHYVRNGIDKESFTPLADAPAGDSSQPLRILVEGHPDIVNKGIAEAVEAIGHVTADHEATYIVPSKEFDFKYPDGAQVIGPLDPAEMADAYRRHDVLLKLSRVEGMFGPPLEAFHCGATAMVAPVTGHDEYIEHGVNSVVVDWDDPKGTARWLDLLARDRELLAALKRGALATAAQWPSWPQSSAEFNDAVARLIDSPQPSPESTLRSNLRDSYAIVEAVRRRQMLELDDARFGGLSRMRVFRLRRMVGRFMPAGMKRRVKAFLEAGSG